MNDQQLLRYSRQIMLPELDIDGQERLLSARVLIVGIGGLGSPVAMYLAAAGVGTLILADHDNVELSNLQRQIVHREATLGLAKVESAALTIAELNPQTTVETINHKLEGSALVNSIVGCSIVVDATDNFGVRYALNEACFTHKVPLVSGAAIRWEGQISAFDPRDAASPCYRCLYPDADDEEALNCSENGVAAPLVGIIGACQALETIKLITGVGQSLAGFVLYFDGKRMEWHKFKLPKAADCPICGD